MGDNSPSMGVSNLNSEHPKKNTEVPHPEAEYSSHSPRTSDTVKSQKTPLKQAKGERINGNLKTLKTTRARHPFAAGRPAQGTLDKSESALLLSLPIDSLHWLASFLSPVEWACFGECNKASNRICKEVFHRVQMHGFRCATEVVTAWVSQ